MNQMVIRTLPRMSSSQRGFTLIELLTVVVIVGILASLSITSFSRAKHIATFSLVSATLRQARTASGAGLSGDPLSLRAGVGFREITSQTDLNADALAKEYLAGLVLPTNVSIALEYRPECHQAGPGCPVESLQVVHPAACKYSSWIRFGDGSEALVDLPNDPNPCG